MKSRYSSLFLILATLMMLGIHLFWHTDTVTASTAVHHGHANHTLSASEFIHANTHHLGFVNHNHAHISALLSGNHHAHGHNGLTKTWVRKQWTKISKWDEQARHDMIARIVRHGGNWTPQTDSFGKQANWLPGWELRWWSFSRNDGETVWVYHARSKTSGQRYTSFTNHVDGKLQNWEIAR